MEPVVVTEERVVLGPQAPALLRERLAHPRLPAGLDTTWQRGVPSDWLRALLAD